MEIIIYGAHNCVACKRATDFLDNNNIHYTYFEVGKDISIEEFKDEFDVTTVPVILLDGRIFFGFSPYMQELILKNKNR